MTLLFYIYKYLLNWRIKYKFYDIQSVLIEYVNIFYSYSYQLVLWETFHNINDEYSDIPTKKGV